MPQTTRPPGASNGSILADSTRHSASRRWSGSASTSSSWFDGSAARTSQGRRSRGDPPGIDPRARLDLRSSLDPRSLPDDASRRGFAPRPRPTTAGARPGSLATSACGPIRQSPSTHRAGHPAHARRSRTQGRSRLAAQPPRRRPPRAPASSSAGAGTLAAGSTRAPSATETAVAVDPIAKLGPHAALEHVPARLRDSAQACRRPSSSHPACDRTTRGRPDAGRPPARSRTCARAGSGRSRPARARRRRR